MADFPEAQMMLARIQDLYRIDASAKDLVQRGRMRATESILGMAAGRDAERLRGGVVVKARPGQPFTERMPCTR